MGQDEEMKKQNNVNPKGEKQNVDQNIDDIPIFKRKGVLIPFFIIMVAAIGAIYWYVGQLGYVSTDDAFIDGNKLSISSKMLDRITALNVDEGDSVTQGQLLVQLDTTDLDARKSQAAAMLDLAKESITLAKVKLEKAQEDFDRAEKQYNDKIIPKEQYDHAQKALQAAKAEYNIDITKISTSQAQLNVIKTDLLNTKIYAPMNGVVAKRWVLKGDVVSPGQPIFTIYNLKNIWVTADLEETKLASIHIGNKVDISVDAYPDQKFEGKVFQIGSNTASEFALIPPSNAAGNFTKITQRVPIKISITHVNVKGQKNSGDPIKLLPGMSVEIKAKIK